MRVVLKDIKQSIYKSHQFRKYVNLNHLINHIIKEKVLRKYIYFKYHQKKRTLIRNSYNSNNLIYKLLGNNINPEQIRKIFFNKKLFPFSSNTNHKEITNYIKKNFSEELNTYLNVSDNVINKKFPIFGKDFYSDNQIDWQYSFFNNFKWKLERSEKLEIRPKNKKIDVKYVWELNRHQFLQYLGFAYYITNKEEYAIEFKNNILNWIKTNPPLYGINWVSGLEISLRLISWIFSLFFFKNSKNINNNKFFNKIFNSMLQHVCFLKYFYTRKSLNHTAGDIFGIYLFSKVFEELAPIKKI